MQLIFPFNPLNEKEADGIFQDEYLSFKALGIKCSLFDFDELKLGKFNPKPAIQKKETIVYRGWMLTPKVYSELCRLVEEQEGVMLSDANHFVRSHHISYWYEELKHLTPETHFFASDCDIEIESARLGWEEFFVKDYVKSNYDDRGSIAKSPTEVKEIVQIIEDHRGGIEGGIALRKVENFKQETEVRYFVYNGICFGPGNGIPDIVREIAKLHKSPFYSVDVVKRSDGELRFIEIGDGQVSDKKEWTVEDFCKIFVPEDVNH